MTSLVDFVNAIPPELLYLIVALAVFGESAVVLGALLPGEVALLAGGAAAGAGHGSLTVLMVVAAIGAVAGNGVGYSVGRRFGPRIKTSRLSRLVGAHRWEQVEAMIARHGIAVVFLARWVGVARTLVPAVAGMASMNPRRFWSVTAASGPLWVASVCLLGYLVGGAVASSASSDALVVVVTLGATALVAHTLVRRKKMRLPSVEATA